jgi:hypothetical protein
MKMIHTMTAEEILATTATIRIVSGEGAVGTAEAYTGKRTVRALKARLTKECCNGDRWARAEVLVSPETAESPAVYAEVSL